MNRLLLLIPLTLSALPETALASTGAPLNLTGHWVGYLAIAIFIIAYALVMAEEFTQLRKSKPVILAAGIIWALIAWIHQQHGMPHLAEEAVRRNLLEYAELMLYLLVAMTYINAMDERQVFEALRAWMVRKGFSFRQLFWLTGILSFFISPLADNLTTALLMCAVVMAVGGGNARFISLTCINIVVAANAGGAFSPFGDITTLMVWQKGVETAQGVLDFNDFFNLFIPSLVNFLVPAVALHFAIPNACPKRGEDRAITKRGAKRIIALFIATNVLAIGFHSLLHLPAVIGMLTGLALLQFFGYYLKRTFLKDYGIHPDDPEADQKLGDMLPFDVFNKVARAEWDTLLFFYGIVVSVGGLSFLGYSVMASDIMYGQWGATSANVAVGLLSAMVDNIPVMFAVLSMQPDMSMGQWLLVTLTAGVGGSILSIGSAAGVALMGQARGYYTFFGHLKWAPIIALGYAASITAHMWINSRLF